MKGWHARLFPCLCAGWLLVQGMAWAQGAPVNPDGTPVFDNLHDLLAVIEVLAIIALSFAIPVAVVLALNWGAQALWRAAFETQPPFDRFTVAALLIALLLGAVGVFFVPAFAALFASFGADLPWQTALLVNYGYLLPGLFILLLPLLVALNHHPQREGYFGVIMVGEAALLVFSVLSIYAPIFRMSEAVSG